MYCRDMKGRQSRLRSEVTIALRSSCRRPPRGGNTLTTFYTVLQVFASIKPPCTNGRSKSPRSRPLGLHTHSTPGYIASYLSFKNAERHVFAWTSHSPRNGAATVACFIMVPSRKTWWVADGIQLRAWLPRPHCHPYDM
jgi:hypothetical protein